ncbi:MAG: glycerol-3-phosphate dehydrogenase/oxidase [Bdellovibrionota bacterium]
MFQSELPERVRALVLGGGIHGVGVLHDLSSRGWKDIHLIEKATLASGTSSKSTKLIHGGLRYLKRISQFGMVAESLHERKLLLDLAPDLVKPIEILIPILDGKGSSSLMVNTGLLLYDLLARKNKIHSYKKLKIKHLKEKFELLDYENVSAAYSFWDAQTDDLALVNRVAESAVRKCEAKISEHCEVQSIEANEDGWTVKVLDHHGRLKEISALYVINCLGPWANDLLKKSSIIPTHHAFNDKGIHLIFEDIGLEKGLLLESPADHRIFFVLPWKGYTLVGTTEELYEGDPSAVSPSEEEVNYLLDRCNVYLRKKFNKSDIIKAFAGLRWLAIEDQKTISSVSRESILGERYSKRGLLMTIYGGKLTSYRHLCEKIGDRVTKHFGEFRLTRTKEKEMWVSPEEAEFQAPTVLQRF